MNKKNIERKQRFLSEFFGKTLFLWMINGQRLANWFTERQICFDSLPAMRIWQKYRLYSSFNFIKKKGLKFTKDSQPITVVCKECLLFYDIDKRDSTRRHFIGKRYYFLKCFLFIKILIFSRIIIKSNK